MKRTKPKWDDDTPEKSQSQSEAGFDSPSDNMDLHEDNIFLKASYLGSIGKCFSKLSECC